MQKQYNTVLGFNLPLGFALNIWIKLICDFAKFREDLVDYIF